MKPSEEDQIQKLIRLKKYESPPEGYFEDFLEEFQGRQRAELLQQSSFGLFRDRLGTWFGELGAVKWVAGAGAAYAGVMAALLMWPDNSQNKVENPNLSPATYHPDKGKPLPTVDFPKIENSETGSTTSREL